MNAKPGPEFEREERRRLLLADLQKEIAIGSQQADRGEFVDGPAVFAEIRKRAAQKRQWPPMNADKRR